MKKYLFLTLLILSIGFLIAVESAPSQTVGYFKRTLATGGWDAISVPFGYANLSTDNILGTQFGDSDQLIDMTTGDNALYIDGVGWIGSIMELTYGHAYWVYRETTNPDLDYYLMGTVDPQSSVIQVKGNDEGGWSGFGLNEAVPININSLPITGVVDSDMIIDVTTGDNVLYIDGVGWIGSVEDLTPSHAYWYNSMAATGFEWTYTPAARSAVTAPISTKKPGVVNSRFNKQK